MNSSDIAGIADALLRGSRNLVQMKRDVTETVRIVVGITNCYNLDDMLNPTTRRFCARFDDTACRWQVFNKQPSGTMVAWCGRKRPADGKYEMGDFRSEQNSPFQTNDVQPIYDSLPTFIEGMIKTFPKVVEHANWQFLIKASAGLKFRT